MPSGGIPAGATGGGPVKGAVAGAMGGLAGAYATQRFQYWWQGLERHEPATVEAAERLAEPAGLFNGLAFGGALWWLADNVAVPAARLGTRPERTPPSAHAHALVSHRV